MRRSRLGGVVAVAVIAAIWMASMVGLAGAQQATAPQDAQEEAVIRTGGPVDMAKCAPCHAQIGDGKNPRIIFKHAFHLLIGCEACHTRFPHKPDRTVKPVMRQCMACHGLRHGPQGLLAADLCTDCHRTPTGQPQSHTLAAGWAGKGHVNPSKQGAQQECAMCHRRPFCTGCHAKTGVKALPATTYIYDPGRGCLGCHADVNLAALSSGEKKSFYVREAMLTQSQHAAVSCPSCHTDFRHFEDVDSTRSYKFNASVSCMGCHEKQTGVYLKSIHGQRYSAGTQITGTCGGCHGGHDIYKLSTPLGKKAIRSESEKVCAGCHRTKFKEYNDYYHGAAYKNGAPDAPSCWDCHGAHEILPAKDPSSTVSAKMLPITCGKCHQGAQDKFSEYAKLIHRQASIKDATFLGRVLGTVRSWLQ